MTDATSLYAYLSRDMSWEHEKPRFTGFQPADERSADLATTKGPIESGRPLVFIMDEIELRQRDNWPGEIGHINVSGPKVLVSEAVRDKLQSLNPEGTMFFPSVLQDIYGNYIEPLYYLHIWQHRDIWDRQELEYLVPFDPERSRSANLTKISLNEKLTLALRDDQRHIIKLARVSPPAVLFAKNVVAELEAEGLTTGANFYPLESWFEGIEFQ